MRNLWCRVSSTRYKGQQSENILKFYVHIQLKTANLRQYLDSCHAMMNCVLIMWDRHPSNIIECYHEKCCSRFNTAQNIVQHIVIWTEFSFFEVLRIEAVIIIVINSWTLFCFLENGQIENVTHVQGLETITLYRIIDHYSAPAWLNLTVAWRFFLLFL